MTILITGASGLLGRCLIELCKENKLEYIGTYNSRKINDGIRMDFDNEDEIKNKLLENKISVVINCIVQRQVDICENNWDVTKQVNIDIVDRLSRVCNELNVNLIHISTDYVFDGKAPPFYPENKTNPLQNYGISKLISEMRVINNMSQYTIIRVPVLYSDNIENLSENAVTVIGKKVLNQIEETMEDDYSVRRPVYIPNFCEFILSFVKTPRSGIFHYYNPDYVTTKYKTALSIAKYLNKSSSHIKPIKSFSNMANRPYDTELKDTKYDVKEYNRVSFETAIERCFNKWYHPVISQSNNDSLFLMMDLDGTILDTDGLHYDAYRAALTKYGIELSRKQFDEIINSSSIDKYISELGIDVGNVKETKLQYMLGANNIKFMSGAESFIVKLIESDINFVVVTNTSKVVVQHYIDNLPVLKGITNWICKEDYTNPKPDSECYELAMTKYYKDEKYKIGFENTINGYTAIKGKVDCVYFITSKDSVNYNKMKKEDIYLISSFEGL
jgi:S-adenosylmethionine synthetase